MRIFLSFLAAALTVLACATAPQGGEPRSLALVGVTVIDPTSSAPPAVDQTILISNGTITAVGASAVMQLPAGTRRVDSRGKFAIPGLWDTHVHFMNTGSTALQLLVANGVTSVREMGGYLDSTRSWQARMAAGTLVGPRIFTPGPILESPQYLQRVVERSTGANAELARRILPYRVGVGDPAEARRVIDSLVALRVDFVKIRNSGSPAAFYATLGEAKRAGLRVAAHQITGVPVRAALDSGLTDLEHAILAPTSRLSAATRDSVYRKFLEHDAWYTPTLTVSRTVMLSGDSAERAIFNYDVLRGDPRRAYASPWLLGWWRMQVEERKLDTSSTRAASVQEAYASSAADVRRMRELGVNILAGTDAGSVLVYPGFDLHEELRLLVQDGGLSPRQALWSATVGPARFARMDERLGRIAAGQIADIVLLDADPLTDVRNTRRIFAVVQGGRYLARSALEALLAGVRTAASR